MVFGDELQKSEKPSIGGDVADFLGTLKGIETDEEYEDSINPYGNPFKDKSVDKMVDYFTSVHGQEGLRNLSDRLESFYGVSSEEKPPEELPDVYRQARKAIDDKLSEVSKEH